MNWLIPSRNGMLMSSKSTVIDKLNMWQTESISPSNPTFRRESIVGSRTICSQSKDIGCHTSWRTTSQLRVDSAVWTLSLWCAQFWVTPLCTGIGFITSTLRSKETALWETRLFWKAVCHVQETSGLFPVSPSLAHQNPGKQLWLKTLTKNWDLW